MLKLTFTDSMPFFNHVVDQQAVTTYALQRMVDSIAFDSIKFKIYTPNCEEKLIQFQISRSGYLNVLSNFNNSDFKNFIRDYLTLNWETRGNYRDQKTSLLDRVNLIFAHEIDAKFKGQFPDNSTWYGYDSFIIFYDYLQECISGNEGVAHQLIEAIEPSKDYLNNSDKRKLVALIKKYKTEIEMNK